MLRCDWQATGVYKNVCMFGHANSGACAGAFLNQSSGTRIKGISLCFRSSDAIFILNHRKRCCCLTNDPRSSIHHIY
ncbi:Uncharacterized protein dnm_067415 [Desulfonema magnum]|uniref:Uncharacterized protein n=1 Tax=Desulfonema magnum TaxID=45655 RepID=A0A975BSB2_9BACT|nr:Uncharacterized protein dnm_067415 [Desulfonema magnum]